MPELSNRTANFTDSVIRRMSRSLRELTSLRCKLAQGAFYA